MAVAMVDPVRSVDLVLSAAVLSVAVAAAAVAKAAVVLDRVDAHQQQLRSADKPLSHHSSALKRRSLTRMVLLQLPWTQCQQLFDRRLLNCASATRQTSRHCASDVEQPLLNERLSSVGACTTIRFALQNDFCMASRRVNTVCSQDDAWIVKTG